MTMADQPSPSAPTNDVLQSQTVSGVVKASAGQLVLGLIFGMAFGFLLQKGGVAKYEVLIGVLLLIDFTVIKVMLSAVIVGMVGIFLMHRWELVELHVKPTRFAANALGGLVFGCGFGLAAYCPGTCAAAFGQGNYDALAVMLGLMAGSYVFAEASGWLDRTVNQWGDVGKLTWYQLFHARPLAFVAVAAPALVAVLALLHFLVDPLP
jgi:uncharacterized protein